MSRLDHVIIAVKDLAQASQTLFDRVGLVAYAGGRVPGIGTESYIIPLSSGYLELISICEEREAVANPLGRAVQAAIRQAPARFLSWAVEPIEPVSVTAERLEQSVFPMKRALPDGGDVTCKVVGLQQALEHPPRPYFVEWESRDERPDYVETDHELEAVGFAWLEVSGDKQQVFEWLGDISFPLEFVEGEPGVQAVAIVTDGEPLILRDPLDFQDLPQREFAKPAGTAEEAELLPGSSPHVAQSPAGQQDVSVFEAVLDRVETAIESAAQVVENVAGDIISPRAPPPAEPSSSSTSH